MLNTYTNKEQKDISLVPGPYKQTYRKILLSELLKAQQEVRKSGVQGTENFEVISKDELQKIREIWVKEQHEIEDFVPEIYEQVTLEKYDAPKINEYANINEEDLNLLKDVLGENVDEDNIHYKLIRNLIDVEKSYSSSKRRAGIYEAIEKEISKCAFDNEKQALAYLEKKQNQRC